MRVQSLGWEDPLEKGMATHSSILALRIPWTEEPGRLQSMESQRAGQDGSTFCLVDPKSSLESSFKMQIAQPNSDSVGLRCVW